MNKISKSFAVIAGIAIVLGLVFAPAAKAQTSNDAVAALLAQIQALTAQLNALKAGSTVSTGFTFTANLTVGSTGAEVTALQNQLGVTPATGYFGPKTKAAVQAFQAEKGISATGYVGPLTRAALNAAAAPVVTTPTTPVVTTPGTVVTDNSDGSLTVSKSSVVSNNAQLKKGETKDLVAAKLQASVGKVAVTRFDVKFDTRAWLYFSSISLKDSNGQVIAQKSNLSASDFTELTVGSDYLLRFEGLNYVVDPSQTQTITVSGTVLNATDKLSTNKNVVVTLPTNGIRTINGKGFTDSLGVNDSNTVTLLSTGSNGAIDARINANSPATRIQTTSTNGQTNNVELMRFDLKSENNNSTVNALNVLLKDNNGFAVTGIFKAVKLTVDGTTYNADEIASTTTFTDLSINLSQDSWKTVVVSADIADQDDFTNGTVASSTLDVSTIAGVDANYNDLTVNTSNDVTGNDITFNKNGVNVSGISTSVTPITVNNSTTKASVAFTFTLSNGSNNDLFISKTPAVALATSTTASSSSLTLVSATASTLAGDTTALYQIPSGSSRTFTFNGVMDNTNGTSGAKEFKITKIYFTDDTSAQKFNVDFGLENLRATQAF